MIDPACQKHSSLLSLLSLLSLFSSLSLSLVSVVGGSGCEPQPQAPTSVFGSAGESADLANEGRDLTPHDGRSDLDLEMPDLSLLDLGQVDVGSDLELSDLDQSPPDTRLDLEPESELDRGPSWPAPTLDPIEEQVAWRGERIEIELSARSDDPTGVTLQITQAHGADEPYELIDETLIIGPLSASHRSELRFMVEAVDSLAQRDEVTFELQVMDRLEYALEEGDPRALIESRDRFETSLIDAIIAELDRLSARDDALIDEVFEGDSISYDPTRNSQYFTPLGLSATTPLMIGARGLVLASASHGESSRGAAFGSDLLERLEQGAHPELEVIIDRLLGWLTRRGQADLSHPQRVSFVGLSPHSSERSARYLDARGGWITSRCDSADLLRECASGAELLVVGSGGDVGGAVSVETLLEVVDLARERGAGLLYVHQHSWNSAPATSSLLSRFGLTMQEPGGPGNFFARESAQWESAAEMFAAVDARASLRELVTRARDDTFSFEIAQCDEQDCSELEEYATEFERGASLVRSANRALELRNAPLFSLEGARLHKLLNLLGDLWRSEVSFPMDRLTTPTAEFLRAYYADHVALALREINPAQPDLGNFSRSDFSHITPQEVTRVYQSKPPSRAAQVYALPGAPLRVTRLDQAEGQVRVKVNSLRVGSTKAFADRGYQRPKYLTSHPVPLPSGETVTLTSPYGGPVQLEFDQRDVEVRVRFEGVGLHPVWRDSEDDLAFQRAIEADEYDWVEFVTSHFEIHSTRAKILETFTGPLASLGSELEALIQTYHHGLTLALAGYRGPGIPELNEVVEYATARGWTRSERDVVQHFNADQPTCGYGCSGNPYDAGWAFEALGHGDLHEVGHNHERGVFKFNGRAGHAHTNFYSYYAKQEHALRSGQDADCQQLPFEALFHKLQDAALSDDPYLTMHRDSSLLGWAEGVTMLIQALMAAQARGVVTRGWHLIGRLHIHERLFRAARSDEAAWIAERSGLGFSALTRAQAQAITNNDYLLIALGAVSELDFRDYFHMWGLETTSHARAQIAQEAYPEVERVYYAAASTDACSLWTAREIPIDGASLWIDLSALERSAVSLNEEYRSPPLSSEDSSVYFLAIDPDVGPTDRVWWGEDGQLTTLSVGALRVSDQAPVTLTLDAYQQRCDTLMTLNAGRVGGCDHRLILSLNPARNPALVSGERYETPSERPLLLRAWRWHEPVVLIDTLALDLSYQTP